jgi:hypothetical protein
MALAPWFFPPEMSSSNRKRGYAECKIAPIDFAPRNLFDIAVGHDNLFHGDLYRWSLQFTIINLTNKTALYNFLSTFSGTHYVTPRAETVQLAFHF